MWCGQQYQSSWNSKVCYCIQFMIRNEYFPVVYGFGSRFTRFRGFVLRRYVSYYHQRIEVKDYWIKDYWINFLPNSIWSNDVGLFGPHIMLHEN